ncbi:MAG: SusC/RagA family TonB-linked outer membrane protein [Bacteroidota bacterium]
MSKILSIPIFCLLLLASFTAEAQRTVSGTVRSGEDHSGLPGVNVLVRGTTSGTITDADGKFSLPVNSENDILVFSFVGFLTQEMSVANRTVFEVTLATDAQQLSEVVVTALGIEKDASTLGYSTQKVSGSDLIKAREPNPLNSLVGKVAGLTVGASSEMLGRPQLVLRGETDVLLVVDGVPVVSDSYNLSPDDIESYNVLKGPNAAALYGSRGRNGAIIITTKKGTKDARGFSIDFNSSTMIEKGILTKPDVQTSYGPGEYNQYRFGDDDFGQKNGYNQNDYDVWGPKFNGQLISQYDSPFDTLSGVRSATPWTARGKNNLDRFLQAGVLSTNNIAVSASGDKYDFRASVSQTYQRGIVPNTDLNTSNFNMSAKFKFTDKFSLESNINYNRQFTDNYPDVTYGPNSIIYNINVWAGADWDINDLKDYWQKGKVGVQQRNFEYIRYNNPWFSSHEWLRGHHKTDTYGYVALKYDIAPWLKASLRTQITNWDLLRTEKLPFSASAYDRDQKAGDYREDRRSLFDNNTDLMLTLDKNVGEDFNISGLVGGNLRTYSYNSAYESTDYLNVPGVYNFGNSKNAVKLYNYSAPMQVISGYYSFDFSYRHYLTLSTTGRLDKYSTFYDGYNTGFYPSVGLSTVISEYVKLPEFISFLKVRGSYANVKNAFTQTTIGPAWQAAGYPNPITGTGTGFSYGDTFQTSYEGPIYNSNTYKIGRPYNNQPAAYYTQQLANTQLKPSANSSKEVGIETKFAQNRIGFNVTYYDAINGPKIINEQWSQASGFNGTLINGVKTEKKGVEITISGTPIKSANGFSWNTMINWSKYVERYKEFYNGLSSVNGAYIGGDSRVVYNVGDRVDGLYGTKFYRDNDGSIIHKDNGAPLTDNLVAQKLGNFNANFVWSFINTLSYKNWALNFQFDGRVGGVGIDYVYKKMLQGGSAAETAEGAYGVARLAEFNANQSDAHIPPVPTYVGTGVALAGDSPAPVVDPVTGQITNMSSLHLVNNTTPYSLQDYVNNETKLDERTLISKTFTKLRQVTVTYTVPATMLERTAFRAASVSLVGRNLFYFSKRKDIDWEQYIGTNANSQILASPTLRRYGININLTF